MTCELRGRRVYIKFDNFQPQRGVFEKCQVRKRRWPPNTPKLWPVVENVHDYSVMTWHMLAGTLLGALSAGSSMIFAAFVVSRFNF